MENLGRQNDGSITVKEYDLYLSKSLTQNLRVLNYPLRPEKREADVFFFVRSFVTYLQHIHEINFKPKQQRLQIVCKSRDTHENGDWDVSRIVESTVVPLKSNFCIGIVHGRDIHLTPVNHILEMKPSLRMLDDAREEMKKAEIESSMKMDSAHYSDEDDSNVVDETSKSVGSDPQTQIEVKFKKKESDRMIAAKKNSYSYLKRAQDEEPWSPLSAIPVSAESHLKFLSCLSTSRKLSTFGRDGLCLGQVLDLIAPESSGMLQDPVGGCKEDTVQHGASIRGAFGIGRSHSSGSASGPYSLNENSTTGGVSRLDSASPSLSHLRKLPLTQQMIQLLSSAHVVHFNPLCEMATSACDELEVLISLERLAVLVAGRWVCKSHVIVQQEDILTCAVRDAILLQFARGTTSINRAAFASSIGVSPDMIKPVLEKIATLKKGREWTLKLDEDRDFIARYPEIVHRYHLFWKEEEVHVLNRLKAALALGSTARRSADASGLAKEKEISNNFTALETEEIKDVLPSDFDALKALYITSFAGSTLADQISSMVNRMLQRFGVVSYGLFLETIRRLVGAPNLITDVTTAEFSLKKVLPLYAEPIRRERYVLRTLRGLDSVSERFRRLVIDVFREHDEVRRSDIAARAQAEIAEPVPNSLFAKVLKEVSTSHGYKWTIKSGEGLM